MADKHNPTLPEEPTVVTRGKAIVDGAAKEVLILATPAEIESALKEFNEASDRVAVIAVARWERERKTGALRYVLRKGLIGWGLPLYVFMYGVQTLLRGDALVPEEALRNAVLWLGCGAVFGTVMWWVSEFNYRKLKASLGL